MTVAAMTLKKFISALSPEERDFMRNELDKLDDFYDGQDPEEFWKEINRRRSSKVWYTSEEVQEHLDQYIAELKVKKCQKTAA